MNNSQASGAAAITQDSVVVAAPNQVSTELENEVAILNLDSGVYYGLNEVGTRIWSLISEPITVSQIQDDIRSEYDVQPERCSEDVLRLLEQLREAGLIEIRDDHAE